MNWDFLGEPNTWGFWGNFLGFIFACGLGAVMIGLVLAIPVLAILDSKGKL